MAASARSSFFTPSAGMNSVAILFPRVMVPVLSISTTSTSPEASTALPLRAMTLCASSLSMPAMPMAGSRPPMVVGIRQTSRATSTGTGYDKTHITGKGLQADYHHHEETGQAYEQYLQRLLVGGLLALGALHHSYHLVQEGLARICGDADLDLPGEDSGSAGNAAEVASCLANDWSRLAGDGRFIHQGHSFDDLSVAGDDLAILYQDTDRLCAASRADTCSVLPSGKQPAGLGLAPGLAQGLGLGPSSSFCQSLGKVGKEYGKPEPDADLHIESIRFALRLYRWQMISVVRMAPISTASITGFLQSVRGSSLGMESLTACFTRSDCQRSDILIFIFITSKCPACLQQQMLQYRSQHKDREEGQSAYYYDCAHQHDHKERAGYRQSGSAGGNYPLLSQRAGYGQGRQDGGKPAYQHSQGRCQVVEDGVGIQAGKGRSVVAAG